jgi:sec-independent protein translocase protein TatB
MLDFSWSHILLFLAVALVVVGPKDLPRLMRMVGRWTGKARAMADQLRQSFDEMARQSELDDLRAEIEALRTQRPLAAVDQALHQSILPPEPMADLVPSHLALPPDVAPTRDAVADPAPPAGTLAELAVPEAAPHDHEPPLPERGS